MPPPSGDSAVILTWRSTLAALHRVEARFGRERSTRWGARTLDIDLLAMGDSVLPDPATQDRWRDLPAAGGRRARPRTGRSCRIRVLQDRAFVLVPMADVAPGWRASRCSG
jgi:2-amino-4-hydroxy-6-hydroxymethyldihydropteridine diphosphokinase